MKFKAKTKDCQLVVRAKTSFGERIDEKELERFSHALFRGFLKPKLIKKNVVQYTGPIGITLYERFKRPVSKRDFLYVLEQLVVAIQKLQSNNMQTNNAVFDLNYVYINEATKEVQFIYIPIEENTRNDNLIEFIETITYSVKPIEEGDNDYASRFIQFFKEMNPFDINRIENFVENEDSSIVNTIKKLNIGQSGFMTNKPQHYYEHYNQKQNVDDLDDATGLLWEKDDDSTGRLKRTDAQTGYIDQSYKEENTGLLANPCDEENTGLLAKPCDEQNTGLLVKPCSEEKTGLLGNTYNEETTALEKTMTIEEETGMLGDNSAVFHFPILYRVTAEEKILVNKPVFRLGKERSYVDYFVTNNTAVSRSHADIITRGKKFFVIDLNSKNGTYINGERVPIHMEIEIQNEDRLKLGNEEFIFYS